MPPRDQPITTAQQAGFSLDELRTLLPQDLSQWEHGKLLDTLQAKVQDIEALEANNDWIGLRDYQNRLAWGGLTPAITKVLALEQGDTDKLCEYSPKALLELVFDVFGDKEVLDNYQAAREEQKSAERELGELGIDLAQERGHPLGDECARGGGEVSARLLTRPELPRGVTPGTRPGSSTHRTSRARRMRSLSSCASGRTTSSAR